MHKILRGVRTFRTVTFDKKKELYESLKNGQAPSALFVTCSDSRIVPTDLTETDAGELFIIRNAGNLVPAFGRSTSGEAASIEFAVCGLKVPDIIVCGHTDCGAIKYLVEPRTTSLPLVESWVQHASEIINESPGFEEKQSSDEYLSWAFQQNVLIQLRHLLTYPFVSEAVNKGSLNVHGWLFDLASGEILACDPVTEKFSPLIQLNGEKSGRQK